MPRRIPRLLLTDPLTQWSELALKTTEMLTAAVEVIGHRTDRMVRAGPLPGEDDQREFTLMGQEKLEAAAESVTAMTAHALETQQRLLTSTLRHMMNGSTAMLSLASSRSPEQARRNQAKLQRALTRSALSASRLTRVPAALAQKGLGPIHSRATANARRLGKKG